MRGLSLAALVAALAALPSCRAEPAPFPQARIVVDTDLPVPQLASRLRVDIFDGAGTWRSTRDFALRSTGDFPASFSVFLPDENARGEVLLRLRLRPDGAERDYHGERYRAPPAEDAAPESVVPLPPGDGEPRMLIERVDRTPTSEPLPELTVDRLVRIRLGPGTESAVRVLLRAACMGHMASLSEASTCIDAGRLLVAATAGDGADDGSATKAGALLRVQRLAPPVAPPQAVAIEGGAFVLGGDDLGVGLPGADLAPSYPPLATVVSGFAMDREEVTVARMRAAEEKGFDATGVHDNTGPLATSSTDPLAVCTYIRTADPKDPERDALPVTCVPFDTARAFCRRGGGDLPTEAQWEYVAAASKRPQKTRYPWGNDTPDCKGTVFARFDNSAGGSTGCRDRGFAFGPRGTETADQDVTVDGVRGLAGGVTEWVLGAPFAYDSACFRRAGMVDPTCDARGPERTLRGGSFASSETALASSFRARLKVGGSTPTIGFRCVYAQ